MRLNGVVANSANPSSLYHRVKKNLEGTKIYLQEILTLKDLWRCASFRGWAFLQCILGYNHKLFRFMATFKPVFYTTKYILCLFFSFQEGC